MDSKPVSFADVFAFVWLYWRRVPLKFAAVVAGVFVTIGLEIMIPLASSELVSAVQAFAAEEASLQPAWNALGWLVGIFALMFAASQCYLRVWMYLASEVMQALVSDGFRRLQRFSSDWHANAFAGATVRKVTRGMWAYDDFADVVVVDLGPALLLLAGFTVSMYLREPVMGLYFGAAVSLFLAVSISVSLLYVAPANRASNDADTDMGGALADAITCNSVIKAFGSEDREDARIYESSGRWRVRARKAWLRSMDAGALQSLMILLLLGGLLSIVLTLAESGSNILDDIVYVITSYFIVNGYIRNIGWQVRSLQRSVNELDDLVKISQTPPQVPNAPGARAFTAGAGTIALENVTFRYENQPEPIFKELSVAIGAGEKVALVGESGSGKSTFVKLIQRFYDVDSGRIVIDGQDVASVTQESLRRAVAIVPQEPILFHRTLHENIAYARPEVSRATIHEASSKAYSHEFISRLTTGYETLVGERGIKLSGGERQRVAIARAIIADAPVLILDEATSSLDSITEKYIQDAIAELMEGRTSIIVAHRLSTIRAADRILVFDKGRIVEEGSHDALMTRAGGAYRRLYDMQALGFLDDVNNAAGVADDEATSA